MAKKIKHDSLVFVTRDPKVGDFARINGAVCEVTSMDGKYIHTTNGIFRRRNPMIEGYADKPIVKEDDGNGEV